MQFRGLIIAVCLAQCTMNAQGQQDHPLATVHKSNVAVPAGDLQVEAWKRQQFLAYDSQYFNKIIRRVDRARQLGKQVFAREDSGASTACSHEIVYELGWLMSSTADFARIDQRLEDLQYSLDHPELEAKSAEQHCADGSWGECLTSWFFKVNEYFDRMQDYRVQDKYTCPPSFLDSVATPEKLTRYFQSVAVSNIAATGIDHRREFNESLSNLMRLILKGLPSDYLFKPKLRRAMLEQILPAFRNPQTGYWGELYRSAAGNRFVDDLSISYHVITYLDGDISDWQKSARPYPGGQGSGLSGRLAGSWPVPEPPQYGRRYPVQAGLEAGNS